MNKEFKIDEFFYGKGPEAHGLFFASFLTSFPVYYLGECYLFVCHSILIDVNHQPTFIFVEYISLLQLKEILIQFSSMD